VKNVLQDFIEKGEKQKVHHRKFSKGREKKEWQKTG
jgi:hypothetical protein